MNKLLFISSFCLTLLACAAQSHNKTDQTNMNKTKEVQTQPTTTIVNTKIPEPKTDANIMVSLQRTPCFGQCPVFKIQLFNDGQALYEGKAHCKRVGIYKSVASFELMKTIQQKAILINYLSLNERYPKGESMITDIPTTISYVKVGTDSKMIYNNYDAPRELVDFEHWLELQFEALNWEIKD